MSLRPTTDHENCVNTPSPLMPACPNGTVGRGEGRGEGEEWFSPSPSSPPPSSVAGQLQRTGARGGETLG